MACDRLSGREKRIWQWVFASALRLGQWVFASTPRLVEHMEWNTQITQPISYVTQFVGRSRHSLTDGHPGYDAPSPNS